MIHPLVSMHARRIGARVYQWVKWFALFAAFVQTCSYAIDVYMRLAHGSTCRWRPVEERIYPPDPPQPYVARFCVFNKYTVLLRLYDINGQTLLAERMYQDLDQGTFVWATDATGRTKSLIFDTSADDGDGGIDLPPTMMDRFRAALP